VGANAIAQSGEFAASEGVPPIINGGVLNIEPHLSHHFLIWAIRLEISQKI